MIHVYRRYETISGRRFVKVSYQVVENEGMGNFFLANYAALFDNLDIDFNRTFPPPPIILTLEIARRLDDGTIGIPDRVSSDFTRNDLDAIKNWIRAQIEEMVEEYRDSRDSSFFDTFVLSISWEMRYTRQANSSRRIRDSAGQSRIKPNAKEHKYVSSWMGNGNDCLARSVLIAMLADTEIFENGSFKFYKFSAQVRSKLVFLFLIKRINHSQNISSKRFLNTINYPHSLSISFKSFPNTVLLFLMDTLSFVLMILRGRTTYRVTLEIPYIIKLMQTNQDSEGKF